MCTGYRTADGSAERSDQPLIYIPTPHHLRRFSYTHNGRVHQFDETVSGLLPGQLIETSSTAPLLLTDQLIAPLPAPANANKRVSQVGGPAPKRREVEDMEEPGPPATPQPQIREESPPWHLDDAGRVQIPSNDMLAPTNTNINTNANGGSQPTLLSPTASPRSSDHENSESERGSPPAVALTAPPSARAYAPISSLAAPASPLTDFDDNNATPEQVKMHMRQLGECFARLPPALHKYTMYSLLRGCSRSTLSVLFNELENALRLDVLSHLPPELSKMVLQHLDVQSVVAASLVCRQWYTLIDGDQDLWHSLIIKENLHLEPQDLQLAKVERWGYSGWSTLYNRGTVPLNAFGCPVNPYKAVFRRLEVIRQNWMRPDVRPRRRIIQSPDKEVITCLEFSEDIIIASTEGKRHLNVYDTKTGVLLHAFTNHEGGVWALKRVGKDIIVSGSIDHTVRVWSLSKNRCTHVFRGHTATVRCLDVVMPDPNTGRDYPVILTGSRDATLRMWRLPNPEDPDYDSYGTMSDAENPYFLAELRGHLESVRTVCGYGDVAVTGSYDFRVRVWEISNRRCRHELMGHENKVYSVVLDTDRNRCISASMDWNIKIWDLDTGSELYSLAGHGGLVGLLRLRAQTLVSGAADYSLRVWDPEDGRHRYTLKGHDSAILCFDHDGRKIVSGSVRDLKLWDVRTGKFARDLLKDVDHIWQVSFDRKLCVAALARGQNSYLEILDFDFDPVERRKALKRAKKKQLKFQAEGKKLTLADLVGSDLTEADLLDADLLEGDFSDTDMEDSDTEELKTGQHDLIDADAYMQDTEMHESRIQEML